MSICEKVMDWPTNKSGEYKKENDTYDLIINEIHTIEDLLECYTEGEALILYPDLYQSKGIKLKSIKDSILMYRKRIANVSEEKTRKELKELKEEPIKLEIIYKNEIKILKDKLLCSCLITELNEHVSQIKALIYKNARFEALNNFIDIAIWKMQDLQNLKNSISKRKVIIIPYLGKMHLL